MHRVSEILSPFIFAYDRYINIYTGASIPQEIFEFARDRGKAVHLAIRYILEGKKLKEDSIDEEIRPYLEQFQSCKPFWDFMQNHKVISLEKQYSSEKYQYTGTPDIVVDEAIIDIKTTKDSQFTLEQLVAYQELVEENLMENTKILIAPIDYLYELNLQSDSAKFRELGTKEGEKKQAWNYFRSKLFEKQYIERRGI